MGTLCGCLGREVGGATNKPRDREGQENAVKDREGHGRTAKVREVQVQSSHDQVLCKRPLRGAWKRQAPFIIARSLLLLLHGLIDDSVEV
ncbi:hypothetical protein BN1708_001693 [Verticillium longisporum]|uniref:Uncharacterized protein n=1 Tax=Verticillium longisporum TaxID=100787 RepID=A0A0G4N4M1_VERLO|nr:hypothetical protein BN1708_001693 [Verticillium longisporum]